MDTQTRLPLFDTVKVNTKQGYSPLKNKPSDAQNLLEDYASTGLSVNNHPISLLKRQHKLNDISWSNTLINKKNKSVVKVLGAVTGRQAPGTAAGVTFLTLEDDIGNINVVVWQATATRVHPVRPPETCNFATNRVVVLQKILFERPKM